MRCDMMQWDSATDRIVWMREDETEQCVFIAFRKNALKEYTLWGFLVGR